VSPTIAPTFTAEEEEEVEEEEGGGDGGVGANDPCVPACRSGLGGGGRGMGGGAESSVQMQHGSPTYLLLGQQ
jgi:hypothetical protein